MTLKQGIPLTITLIFGLLTLVGLILPVPALTDLALNWAAFIVAVALLLGVANLLAVHAKRLFSGNVYSGVLVLSMLAVFALAITDHMRLTDNAVDNVFQQVQAPLEAALSSLLAFFLLFSGFQLLKRQRTIWSVIFLFTAVFMLLSSALSYFAFLPDPLAHLLVQLQELTSGIIVTAGMRGILIGVALGTILISVRVLTGVDRPYHK
ncbi:MAG: hypothetical protein ACE5E7_18240 [Anaerolineae bacterium]